MKLAVLSGKGGTGKTFIAVNLAASLGNTLYMDCDVEAPNGHLFFKPRITEVLDVTVKVPEIDHQRCTGCRVCIDFCQFNALAYIGGKVKVFEHICHNCGGCRQMCPQEAVSGKDIVIGCIECGESEETELMTGTMAVGTASGVPIIDQMMALADRNQRDIIIDAPPGSACLAMAAIRSADLCLMVAEPTAFGIHNMTMVHELTEKMGKPSAVVINRSFGDDSIINQYCIDNGLKVLAEIPYDKKMAYYGSMGKIAARESLSHKKLFLTLMASLKEAAADEATSCT